MSQLISKIGNINSAMVGGKATNLGILMSNGVAVPEALVYPPEDSLYGVVNHIKTYLKHPKFVAVRSSAIGEDGGTHSFAGQFKTFLNVDATDSMALKDAITGCRISSIDAQAYAKTYDGSVGNVVVIVQRMIQPLYAGVMFTADPFSGRRYVSIIEWVKGLGDKLVSGEVSPLGSLEVVTASSEVLQGKTPRWMWQKVLALGRKVDELYEQPMDIEWAYTRGKVWCLQARPITNFVATETATLSGNTVVGGIATGTAKWLPSRHDKVVTRTPTFNEGDLLLTEMTDPHMITEMCLAAGIATRIGGRTCHAAIVAREMGKPCIVGVEQGLRMLHGRNVTINADEGAVLTND